MYLKKTLGRAIILALGRSAKIIALPSVFLAILPYIDLWSYFYSTFRLCVAFVYECIMFLPILILINVCFAFLSKVFGNNSLP